MNKAELRKLYLEKRRIMDRQEVAAESRSISREFFQEFDFANIRTVHCFISIPKFNEVDTSSIFETMWRDHPHIRTVAPRIDLSSGAIENLTYHGAKVLVENQWGVREPEGNEKADSGEIDLIVVPLVCFDRNGHRVGYGKGFYDRLLTQCRPDCRKVGLSFFEPVSSIDDVHDGDIALDACVTPESVIRF